MTGLLLDTSTLVWALEDSPSLSTGARDALLDRANDVFASAGSAWELATKYRLGRLPQAEPLVRRFEHIIAGLGAIPLAISIEHAIRGGSLEWAHRDPFDRLLAAQALTENLTLLTPDRAFSSLSGLRTRW